MVESQTIRFDLRFRDNTYLVRIKLSSPWKVLSTKLNLGQMLY